MTHSRIPVLMLTNAMSLGGIEKTVIAFARTFDPARFEVHIGSFLRGGEREAEARATGLPFHCFNGESNSLHHYLVEHKILAVHSHEQGSCTAELMEAVQATSVACLIQSNVFSLATPQDGQFDRQLFISMTNLLKYAMLNDLPDDIDRRAVIYNPVDIKLLDSLRLEPSQRKALRKRLGLAREQFVIGKIARKTLGKWSDLNLDILPGLLKRHPEVRFLVVGMPDSRWRLAQRMGVAKAIVRLPETADFRTLAGYYQAMDAYVHFSKIGECCSVAIQEAMSFSLPVITNSTPFTKQRFRFIDNGQVEQVQSGITGEIANAPTAIVEAVSRLIEHPGLRESYGAAGRQAVLDSYDLPRLSRQLEKTTLEILTRKGVAEAEALLPAYAGVIESPTAAEIAAYAADYSRRSAIVSGTGLALAQEKYNRHLRDKWRSAKDLISLRRGKER